MFNFFGKSKTTKPDVIMAFAAALIGAWKAYDTLKDYKSEQEEKEIMQ